MLLFVLFSFPLTHHIHHSEMITGCNYRPDVHERSMSCIVENSEYTSPRLNTRWRQKEIHPPRLAALPGLSRRAINPYVQLYSSIHSQHLNVRCVHFQHTMEALFSRCQHRSLFIFAQAFFFLLPALPGSLLHVSKCN